MVGLFSKLAKIVLSAEPSLDEKLGLLIELHPPKSSSS